MTDLKTLKDLPSTIYYGNACLHREEALKTIPLGSKYRRMIESENYHNVDDDTKNKGYVYPMMFEIREKVVFYDDVRQEAIKWIKRRLKEKATGIVCDLTTAGLRTAIIENDEDIQMWMKFHNITKEELE